MSDPVHEQYEALPYPPRNPQDETKRLVTGSPSRLAELNHFAFGGRRDFAKPFRALVAGGGTGDAAIMLAQQLADAGATAAEIVYLDWSTASRKVAEARAAVRKLANIRFVTGSLLDLDALQLGRFDYIDCCGVLHHLPDPPATLTNLVSLLAEDGGMGLMVYGQFGRFGVYQAQDMLRALSTDGDDVPARLAMAKKLLAQLPPTNWLKRNPFVTDHIVEGDAGIYDLLLHARDQAYTVPEIDALVAAAGLRLVTFVPPARYEPASYLSDAGLLRRLSNKSPLERAAFAESLAGNIKSHVFYVVRRGNDVTAPTPDRGDAIPVYCESEMAQVARGFKPGSRLTASVDGWTAKLPLPALTPAIAELIDGKRTLDQIASEVRTRRPDLSKEDVMRQFAQYYAAFHGVGHLMLKLQG